MRPNNGRSRPLSPRAAVMLEAIQAAGADGITRSGIAAAIGTPLKNWHLRVLKRFQDSGQIIISRQPNARHFPEYRYRYIAIA